jgi:hypothetical protein
MKFEPVFIRLRSLLLKHQGKFNVKADKAGYFCLEGATGPATLKAWGGKMKQPTIPVAWVQIGKTYVSFHLMGLQGNPRLQEGISKQLRARMQGKTCLNFRSLDEALFAELDDLTSRVLTGMLKAGYVCA